MESYTDVLDSEALEYIARASKNPKTWAELYLSNFNSEPLTPFKARYSQRKIFSSKKRIKYICVDGDTLVIDPTTLVPTPIKDCEGLTETFGFDFQKNQVVRVPCKWQYSGYEPTLRLKMASGITQILTHSHELFNWHKGWIIAKALKVGDRVLGPAELPIFGGQVATATDIETLITRTLLQGEIDAAAYQLESFSLKQFIGVLWSQYGRLMYAGDVVGFILSSPKISLGLQHLLLRLGIASRVDNDGCLFITDAIDTAAFLNAIGLDVPILDAHSPRRWDIIVEITPAGSRSVYDLVIDHPDHNFIGNNLVIHNCQHRRSGKTSSVAIAALWHAMTRNRCKIRILAPSSDQMTLLFGEIDSFVNTSDYLLLAKASVGWTSDPQLRTFVNGSTISGHLLGTDVNLSGKRRGLTADIVIIDESQELNEEHWRAIGPIITGDIDRMGKVYAYICGTIHLPPGPFFKKVMTYVETGVGITDDIDIIYLPVTENEDYTDEMIAQAHSECATESEWETEWLLRPGSVKKGVFLADDIRDAATGEWAYGNHNIKDDPNHFRYIAVDWDKVQAPTNIVVGQYSLLDKKLRVIYREEIPQGPFTLTNATKRVLELAGEYKPFLVLTDGGMGEMQFEVLQNLSYQPQHDYLYGRMFKVNFQATIKVKDPDTGEVLKPAPRTKAFIVGLLRRALNNRQLSYPADDSEMTTQLLGYKIKSRTDSSVKFTADREHLVDCDAILCYGVHMTFEDAISPENAMAEGYQFDSVEWALPGSEDQAVTDSYDLVAVVPRDDRFEEQPIVRRGLDGLDVGSGGRLFDYSDLNTWSF